MKNSLAELSNQLHTGTTSAEAILDDCLARIDDSSGEGSRVMLHVNRDIARATAQMIDISLQAGQPSGPLAGIPVSVKDLCDVAGEVTMAGSKTLVDAPPAKRDATIIARLRAAGAMFLGRTNMSEFAYSGVGINPHYDTPRNPYDRETGRVPGGSSSGAAISVTDGMAAIGIGTDTGGSCRIPAALCGLVGYKPTAKRIPLEGIWPLSLSLDSVGSLGHSVACVALLDAVMAGEMPTQINPAPLAGLRFCLPENVILDDLDTEVQAHFFEAVAKLEDAGVLIEYRQLATFNGLPEMQDKGGIAAAEALAWHQKLLAEQGDLYDPRVRARMLAAEKQSAVGYIKLLEKQARLQAQFATETYHYDAVIMPTTPKIAPPISAFERDEEFTRLNGLLLRNTSIANVLDLCAISLPCQPVGKLPVGFGLMGKHMGDQRLFEIAISVEQLIVDSK